MKTVADIFVVVYEKKIKKREEKQTEPEEPNSQAR